MASNEDDNYLIPKDIPWEAGTNRFASQKGMPPIGGSRNNMGKIDGGQREWREGEGESDIPKLYNYIKFKPPSQSGQSPFGGSGLQVKQFEEGDEKKQAGTEQNPDSQTFLSRWSQSNPNAKNDGFGAKRDATVNIVEGKTHMSEENRMKCEGVLPLLQDKSGIEHPGAVGIPRQATSKVEGLDLTEEEEMQSRKVTPWTSGGSKFNSQSKTGGFQKTRDVTGRSWYQGKEETGMSQSSQGFLGLLSRPNPHASNAHIGRNSRNVVYQNPILKDVPKYLKDERN